MSEKLSRRGFIQDSILAATALTAGVGLSKRAAAAAEVRKTAGTNARTKLTRTIHPRPNIVNWGNGMLNIQQRATLRIDPAIDAVTIEMFKETWDKFMLGAVELTVKPDPALAGNAFALSPAAQSAGSLPELKSPATYALTVDDAGVTARAADVASLRYAWFTLLQLPHVSSTPEDTLTFALPHVVIQDWPAMKFRGLHLCVFPETTPLMIEKAIRLAGFYKFTHVIVEFWGMLHLETMKELSWPEALSKAEGKRLIDLGRNMGMEMIPMFNCWGHATASRGSCGRHVILDQNPSLAPLFEPDGWTWCLSNPRTRTLLKNIIRELCEFTGPGGYFHIGCDEAYSHATCDRCRQDDPVKLLVDHVNDLTAHLEGLGRRPIMWGDTLLEQGKWPKGFTANGSPAMPTHLALDRISRRIVIADWHYNVTQGDVPTLAHFRDRGFTALACPWDSAGNIRTLARGVATNGSLGLLATTWHHQWGSIPMLAVNASATWSQSGGGLSGQDLANLLRKLVPAQGQFARAGWYPCETSGRTAYPS